MEDPAMKILLDVGIFHFNIYEKKIYFVDSLYFLIVK